LYIQYIIIRTNTNKMKKIKQLIHKIFLTRHNKKANNELIEQKKSCDKPDSNKVTRNKHGFPQYIID